MKTRNLVTALCALITTADLAQAGWVNTYNGVSNGWDAGTAIASDASGNVYVAGLTTVGPKREWVVIKYTAAGAQSWVASYTGAGSGNSIPQDIAVDNAGGVYVTGYISTVSTGNDLATIKLSASTGAQLWQTTSNGAGNGDDVGSKIAVDSAGQVIVGGTMIAANGKANISVRKLNPSTGALVDSATHNGAANVNDVLFDMVVNGQQVYVLGTQDNNDIVTIRYGSGLGVAWAKTFLNVEPGYLAVDSAGNAHITFLNSAGTNKTIRYNVSTGTAAYNVAIPNTEQVWGITTDATNNAIISGRTAFYHSNVNNFYSELVLTKFSTSGALQYNQRWTPDSFDAVTVNPYQIQAVGPDVFVGSRVYGPTGIYGNYLSKFNFQGTLEWAENLHPDGGSDGGPLVMDIEASGTVNFAGNANQGADILTIKR